MINLLLIVVSTVVLIANKVFADHVQLIYNEIQHNYVTKRWNIVQKDMLEKKP
jgi:hypothetical protein